MFVFSLLCLRLGCAVFTINIHQLAQFAAPVNIMTSTTSLRAWSSLSPVPLFIRLAFEVSFFFSYLPNFGGRPRIEGGLDSSK